MANNVDTVTRDPEQLAAPIASLFGGVRVAVPQIKIDPSTVVVNADVLETIETMRGLHDMRVPWIEGLSYKSTQNDPKHFDTDFNLLIFFHSTRSWNSCTT